MQRIVFVVESLFELGPVRQLQPLLRHILDSNDFEVHLISLAADSKSNINGLEELDVKKLNSHRRPFNRWNELRKSIAVLAPHIVHAWGDRTHSITQMATWGLSCKRTFSHFEHHEPNAQWLRSKLQRKDDRNVFSHSALLENNQPLANSQVILNPVLNSPADRHQSRSQLLNKIGLHEKRQSLFLAGTVAYHEPKYRLKDLVWAIDLLCCVRDDVHLLVFAEGDTTSLAKFISKTVAGENVHLIDAENTDPSDVTGLDFYWHCHRLTPNPVPMIDAMASGVPVIGVLENETRDLILPLQTGLATNFGARDEFARWTKYLIEQNESAHQLSLQAKAHVEKLFKADQMVESYLKLYQA